MERRYEIPYGRRSLTFTLPDAVVAEVFAPKQVAPVADPKGEVIRALRSPLADRRGDPGEGPSGPAGVWRQSAVRAGPGMQADASSRAATTLERLAAPGATVAIAVNDKTRPVPHGDLLPPLLEHLLSLGYRRQNIVLVIATGAHPVMTPDEFPSILPREIVDGYRIECHDGYDEAAQLSIGTTSRGTPALFDRTYVEADVRIVVGSIEPHQFMGYSGGAKSAAIGLAGAETINVNHARMLDPAARLGSYRGNPAREDVEELGRMLGIHFALNAVLNDHKQIVRALAGNPVAVMEAGIPIVRAQFELAVDGTCDLVVASPGGHPKDINLYQAQKALAHASIITREGGTIVLAAACPEGSGSASYERWVSLRDSNRKVIEDFRAEGFRVGPHKAFQIARDAVRSRVILVSDMPEERVRRFLLEPAESVDEALAIAAAGGAEAGAGQASRPSGPLRIGIMPYANATIPVIADGASSAPRSSDPHM